MLRKRNAKINGVAVEDKTSPTSPSGKNASRLNLFQRFPKRIAFCIAVVYLLPPVIICIVPQITEQLLFSNMYNYWENDTQLLKNPTSQYKLEGAASFYIECDDNELGVWHVLPKSKTYIYAENNNLDRVEDQLYEANTVIVYHHGSGMSRATTTGYTKQKAAIYELFQSEGYHTIAFDYRGFGDSSGWPSESGLVNDSVCMLNWVKKRVKPDARIYFWGHSLGAAVATIAAKKMFDKCEKSTNVDCPHVDALILEAGFSNIRSGAQDNILVQMLNYIYSKFVFSRVLDVAFRALKADLATDDNLSKVKCPVMLLHAEDDDVIPYQHGEDLYNICKTSTDIKMALLVKFKSSHGYGHMNIYKAPELPKILSDFLTKNYQVDKNFHMITI